jgi:inner membrane protease subunit 2
VFYLDSIIQVTSSPKDKNPGSQSYPFDQKLRHGYVEPYFTNCPQSQTSIRTQDTLLVPKIILYIVAAMTSKFRVRPFHVNTALKYASLSLLSAATLATINRSLFEVIRIDGSSMSPALSPSCHETGARDRVLVLRRDWQSFKASTENTDRTRPKGQHVRNSIQRGDIITFLKPHDPEKGESVKRVVGVAGDVIWRDARRVGREQESNGATAKDLGLTMLPPVIRVPIGHVWVEGDNWRESLDSNNLGAVSLAFVEKQEIGS